MSPPKYAPISATDELEGAFESDDEDNHNESELHPITPMQPSTPRNNGGYDFERDYDYPPPGSPPRPSALALPNTFGNTNGSIPSPTAVRMPPLPTSQRWAPAFIRRAVGAVLPTHYVRVPTTDAGPATRPLGGGVENDGVFANVMAKPAVQRNITVQDENGDVHVMPEESQKDVPPSYAAAQADAVPPYWETTIHAPHLGADDDMIIEGLPSGSLFSFAWNFLISLSFQFVGFMVTYVLHTTHAAKFGSRAGLGITLIQYGLYSRGGAEDATGSGEDGGINFSVRRLVRRSGGLLSARLSMDLPFFPSNGTATTYDDPSSIPAGASVLGSSTQDWLSFLLMTAGWFLLLSSLLGYTRVKRWERSIRQSSQPQPAPTPEAIALDRQVRQRLNSVFGMSAEDYDDDYEHVIVERPDPHESAEDASIRRSLRAAGMI
ncbi:hypothetical protein BD410DRAFT_604041 [Rickenella mellea]|uniref:Metal homeostatis protein bsd2 n=1 Tax=Rickenella mellea TaxID=50990 RepID=A0A4Y7QEQ1_9AGAM|nr:hypothetical protein BD410DRAFT_604041 [Rickenella mellea]